MALKTILEMELDGRGQGWTDKSADLANSTIQIEHGIKGSGISDRVASSGSCKFELVNDGDPTLAIGDFDGVNDTLSRDTDLEGVTPGKLGTFCTWVYFDGVAAQQKIFESTSAKISAEIESGVFRIIGRTSTPTTILLIKSSALQAGQWYHFAASWDMTDSGEARLYKNGVDDLTITMHTDDTIAYDSPPFVIGGRPPDAQFRLDGRLADLYFNPVVNIDFDLAVELAKFIDANGLRVPLGISGEIPTGAAPPVYMRGPASIAGVNSGTGGGFVINGSPSAALGPPMTVDQGIASTRGLYSFNHDNLLVGFGLGIGIRIRVVTTIPGGTGTGYLIDNGGGYPGDTTTIAVDTGSGSVDKDDVITFAGVSGEYVVSSGGSPATSVTFEPGLAGAVADGAAITTTGRNFTRHRGRLDNADPAPGVFERRTVPCESVDWMDDAARAKLSVIPVQQDKRADEIFETLVGAVPFQPVAIEADESPDTYSYALDTAKDESSAVLSELQKLAMSEFGLIYSKADGTIVFESRNRRALSEGVVDTFLDTETVSGFAAPVSRDDSPSRVQVITHPRKVDSGDTTVLFRLDNPLEVPSLTTKTVFGPYRDPDQEAARVGGINMRTPVASTDYLANTQADGGGSDITGSVSLSVSFGGNGASVAVTNNGFVAAFITLLQLRGRGVFDFQNVVLDAVDDTAQLEIGTTQTADMPYQDDVALGEELAIWLLALYKDSENLADRVTIRVPRSDETLANRVLVREISDRIDVTEQMTGFAPVAGGGNFIQSIGLAIDGRNNLTVSWGLAPANRTAFWLLEIPGRTELDQTTVLGFGLIVGHTDASHCDTHDDEAHADVAHTDDHTDTHTDSEHEDSEHTDEHSDTAHEDVAFVDSHDDSAHGDVSHTDSHSDVTAVDEHGDTAHTDEHTDTAHDDFDDHIDGI